MSVNFANTGSTNRRYAVVDSNDFTLPADAPWTWLTVCAPVVVPGTPSYLISTGNFSVSNSFNLFINASSRWAFNYNASNERVADVSANPGTGDPQLVAVTSDGVGGYFIFVRGIGNTRDGFGTYGTGNPVDANGPGLIFGGRYDLDLARMWRGSASWFALLNKQLSGQDVSDLVDGTTILVPDHGDSIVELWDFTTASNFITGAYKGHVAVREGSGDWGADTPDPLPYDVDAGVILAPDRFDNTSSWYAHNISQGAAGQILAAGRHINQQAFYDVGLLSSAQISADRFDNHMSFYQHGIDQGTMPQVIATDVFISQQFFGAHTLAARITISPGRLDNQGAFFDPSVAGKLTINTDRFDNTNNFYTHSTYSTNRLNVGRFDSVNKSYGHTVNQQGSPRTILVNLHVNQSVFNQHVVISDQSVYSETFVNSQTFYNHSAKTSSDIQPALFTNGSQYYQHSVTVDNLTIFVSKFDNRQIFPYHNAIQHRQKLYAGRFDNQPAFHHHKVTMASSGERVVWNTPIRLLSKIIRVDLK